MSERTCAEILEAANGGGAVTHEELRRALLVFADVNREIEGELVALIEAIRESRDSAGLSAMRATQTLSRVVFARKSAPSKWLGLKD